MDVDNLWGSVTKVPERSRPASRAGNNKPGQRMSISERTQAVLLLTLRLPDSMSDSPQPLTPTEWNLFCQWLGTASLCPEALLQTRTLELADSTTPCPLEIGRIRGLLQRGMALAVSLDKWTKAGIWVRTRSDNGYPQRLRARLQSQAPPVLFGAGSIDLLNQGGVAMVGSRNAPPDDLETATGIAVAVSDAGLPVVSGGARGVDQASMDAALEVGGTAIGVLCEGLFNRSLTATVREHLSAQSLAIVSPYSPEARFSVGNAMGRNKFIYCLADSAVVVHSGTKGGTWEGANETLRQGWVPVWVNRTQDRAAGNQALIDAGATWIDSELDPLFRASPPTDSKTNQPELATAAPGTTQLSLF
jgi:predicted Rossmann fold nucleotide-binding protein DprA/Smf involved in DNA uptake